MEVSPLAGKPADPSILINVFKLVSAYYSEKPAPILHMEDPRTLT